MTLYALVMTLVPLYVLVLALNAKKGPKGNSKDLIPLKTFTSLISQIRQPSEAGPRLKIVYEAGPSSNTASEAGQNCRDEA